MRKILFFCFAILFATEGKCQLTKGVKVIGGNANFYLEKSSGKNNYNIDYLGYGIAPEFGIFISKKVMVGLTGGYTFNQVEDKEVMEKESKYLISLSPIVKYYSMVNERFGIVVGATAGYGIGKLNREYSDLNEVEPAIIKENNNYSKIQAQISPGLIYFISNKIGSPKLGIEASLGILNFFMEKEVDKSTKEVLGEDTGIKLNFNPSAVTIGINYYFGFKNNN